MNEFKDFEVKLFLGENKDPIIYNIKSTDINQAFKNAQTILDKNSSSKDLIKGIYIKER